MNHSKQEKGEQNHQSFSLGKEKKSRQIDITGLLWKRRIIKEKGVSEEYAAGKVEKIKKLIEYMQYGHALIAYHKQDDVFCLSSATLIGYERFFHLQYDWNRVRSTVVFWNGDEQEWRSFRIENFMEWKPIV